MDLYIKNNRVKDFELPLFQRTGKSFVVRGTIKGGIEHCDRGKPGVRAECEEAARHRLTALALPAAQLRSCECSEKLSTSTCSTMAASLFASCTSSQGPSRVR